MKIISYLKDKENLKAGLLSVLKKAWGKTWLAVNQFIDKNLFQYAGALAFNTVLAIVPLVALFFAISRGFGYSGIIETTIRQLLSSQPDAANYIIQFANSYLSNARSSAIIGFGVLVMLYSVIGLINNIETVFNIIWNVKKTRSISRRVMSYLSMFFLVPVTIVIVSGIHLAVSRFIGSSSAFAFLAPLLQLLIQLIPIIVITLVFTMVYKHVPNTRVRFKHAIGPALLAAIFMELLQRAYVYGQVLLSSYNAIYGSLAALPLFMLWVQISWTICLFGAELTYTSQNLGEYAFLAVPDEISHRYRLLLSTVLMSKICERKDQEQPAYTAFQLKMVTGLPIRIVSDLLHDMVDAGLLNAYYSDIDSEEAVYTPAVPIDHLTVGTIVDRLETRGKWTIDMDLEKLCDSPAWHKAIALRHQYLETLRSVEIREL